MTSPTHYLDLLLLLAGVFPSGLGFSLGYVLGADPEGGRRRGLFLVTSLVPFVGVLAAAAHFRPESLSVGAPPSSALWIGFPAILAVFAVEYGAGLVFSLVRTGRLPMGAGLHQFWASPMPASQYVSLLLIVIGEELLYRRVLFHLLIHSFGWAVGPVVVVSALLYALNHSFMGPGIVVAKIASGLVYALVFVWSGSVLAPIIAHAGFNWSLLALLGRRPTERVA
jgi:membrane protease YdiL (CAAX protease family)